MDVPAPVMYRALKPRWRQTRAERPSWTPGQMREELEVRRERRVAAAVILITCKGNAKS